jgi:DNA polymerase III subunit delta'
VSIVSEILGQERIIRALCSAQSNLAVAHAYLFYGPQGSGKKTLGSFFARALNCTAFPHGPCENCLSCRKIAAHNHPDVHLVLPEGKSLKIDQVRQVKKLASFSSREGRYQVFILDASMAVTPEAANSLLKLLEEPPPDTVLVVLAENPDVLPPTIVSRCQLFAMERLTAKDIFKLLEPFGLTAEQMELAVSLAEGIPGKALEAAAADWQQLFSEAFTFLNVLPGRGSVSSLSGQLAEMKNIGVFLDILLILLRDLLVFKSGGRAENIACCTQLEAFAELSRKWDGALARKALETVLHLQENLRSPVNVRLAVEQALRRIKEAI